ncbi:hypothetical protein [Oleiagrimonas soli]|uniref:Uncharacterized protein n=1 Tax=Oleiagrimonas soli TaxID=1543381 RepID=A0A099CYF3_9GAMM|nr:hypothetical protein [Oleiagrimonas soli]KGI78025.1 hypothetical protein LF63_0106515 [Oleiagrimonas soli]MBB6183582.1 hypothetical protein [Oleiagrimonas soli]
MQAHVFKGIGRIFGVTPQRSGENLPAKYAPWTWFKTIEIRKGETRPGIHVDECLDDIERFGAHITDAHERVTEEAMR